MANRRILLVEDNEDDEKLCVRALKKNKLTHDNELIIARDGVEALDYLLGTGANTSRAAFVLPAVVLLDLKLPKLDGLGVLQRLRLDERTKRLPVVILTSSKEQQDLCSSYDFGANSYIRKPVDFEQFAEAIRHLGIYWLGLNETAPC
jgi:two-component system response regulator